MSITVTAEPLNEPPRNVVTVSITSGYVMSSAAVYRNDSNGRTLLRDQPSPGFDTRTVYDYECPYGESVTYDWEVTYYNPADNATVFSEAWTSFPGSWTGDTGSGSIASNRLTLAASLKTVSRTVATDWDQIVLADISATFTAPIGGGLRFYGSGSNQLTLSSSGGFLEYRGTGGVSHTVTTIDASDTITITRTATGYSFEGTGGSSSAAASTFDLTSIEVKSSGVQTVVGSITVSTSAAPSDLAESSTAVTLDSDATWLIHPAAPALSFPVQYSSTTAATFAGADDVVNPTNTTLHKILGSRSAVAVSTGARGADETGIRVTTFDADERSALRALLATDFPILVQVPPSWGVDFSSGFYSVGATTERRPGVIGSEPSRETHLPLSSVQSPIASVQATDWTYAQLVLEEASYSAVLSKYSTYATLASHTEM